MLRPRPLVAVVATVVVGACGGGGGGSSTPTSPTAAPAPTPITMSLRLTVTRPAASSATDVQAGARRLGINTALAILIATEGGSAEAEITCSFSASDNLVAIGTIPAVKTPAPVQPGTPFTHTVNVRLDGPAPPPDVLGSFTCRATGTDQRGGSVSATETVSLPISAVSPATSVCTPGDTTICALNNRFQIQVDWKDTAGQIGTGRVLSNGRFNDGGYFWFFDQNNWNVLVQVLNNCSSTSDHYWVFMSGQTNAEVNITVTDTQTGVRRPYQNPLGQNLSPMQDTIAFATCP